MYAVAAVAVEIITNHLQHVGMFVAVRKDGADVHDVQPVVNFLDRMVSQTRSLAADLLLTPASQARQKAREARASTAMQQHAMAFAELALAREAGEVLDGDFAAADGE
jgi:phage terminase small subunit